MLHAIGTSQVGGTERFLVDLVSRHNRSGIESSICVLDAPGVLAAEYQRVAARVDHLNISRNPLVAARRWRESVSAAAPDVLVLYGSRANALGRLVPLVGRRPALITALRSTVPDENNRSLARWMDRLTFRRIAACVSNSHAALSVLIARGYPEGQLTYIAPGIEWPAVGTAERDAARAALNVGRDDVVVLSVANLKAVKQHIVLLEASRLLGQMGLKHRLWLVGEGPERPRLQKTVHQLGLDDTVLLAGREADPRRRFAAADVFVLTSRWEGTPMSILEAMAAGLPVVAPRIGDIPSLVVDGTTGRLVEGYDPAQFASALAEAIGPGRNQLWRQAARDRALRFSADIAASRYAELFRWAAERTPGSAPVFDVATRPVRILRVLSRLNVGGPTLHVVLLTQAFNAGAFTTRLVSGSVGPHEGDMSYVATERDVPVSRLPELGRSVSPFRDITALAKLTRLMMSFRPAIVHTHASKAGALGRLAAALYNVTRRPERRAVIVHTYHGHTFEGYFGRLPALIFRLLERGLARATDIIVVLSDSQRDDIVRRFRVARSSQVRVVPLGLDLEPFFSIQDDDVAPARSKLGLPASTRAIVAAGRLTAIKNLGMLLRAFASVARSRPSVHLFIAGDGEDRAELVRESETLGIADRVSFLGWQRDMAAVYAACDVVALTSHNEGTPVALIEAIAAGCRAVSTNVGGVATIVDSSCGILVQPGMEQAFSKALEGALDAGRLDRPTRLQMRRFSIDRLVADLTAVYTDALDRRRSRREKGRP